MADTKKVRVTCSSLVDKRAPPPPATGGHAEACPRCPRTKDPGRPEGPRAPSLPEGCGTLRAKSVAAITKTETERQESESRRPESLVALCNEASNKGEKNASGTEKQKENKGTPTLRCPQEKVCLCPEALKSRGTQKEITY